MQLGKNYVQEIQKFTTSQYWNSGVRITTGLLVPMLVMLHQGWLSTGMPLLFGALFVSLTDTPGPIHHRRNGMLVAIALNTFIVLITGFTRDNQVLLLGQIIIFGFLYSMLGIYGARAGAVGTLALVVMLIHLSPAQQGNNAVINAALTAGGGLWYATFSLLLYRLQPYRLVEQALGENLIQIADYIRGRAAFYKNGADIQGTFTRVMKKQVDVLKVQSQVREVLFKTRQFVGDASPKSRSMMMIFLESLDLFEETMYSYQDYSLLHKNISPDLINKFYRVVLQIVAEFEYIGLTVQAGAAVRRMPALDKSLEELDAMLRDYNPAGPEEEQSLTALHHTMSNIRSIVSRLRKIVLYTRMEAYDPDRFPDQELEKPARTSPFTLSLLVENFTLRSNNFRYAVRITSGLLIGYGVSALFSLSHAYWVMLTVLTILKPVYNLTRTRNIQRVLGTLGGVLLGSIIIYLVSNSTMLVVIMIICMLIAYSLLRLNYLGFVTFLTVYVLITFHFLNPVEFRSLIGERLVDTLIGSVIAALASRFIFPVWQHYNIQPAMKKMLLANNTYFLSAWNALRDPLAHRKQYNGSRNAALVALTNLSDNFQQMLSEPGKSKDTLVHQFVIASHTLTSRISALTAKDVASIADAPLWTDKIIDTMIQASSYLDAAQQLTVAVSERATPPAPESLHSLSIIYSLVSDIRNIAVKIGTETHA